MKEELLRLAGRWEAHSNRARETECSPEYQAYWHGYAVAYADAALALRASVKEQNNGN